MTFPIHQVAAMFPPMSADEFAGLVADIREHGQREPIILHEGAVIDGRNRYLACQEIGIEPRTVEWDGEGSVEAFVVSKNLHRRHLNESQRAMIAARLANLRAGQRVDMASQSQGSPIGLPPISQPEAAALLNVGLNSLKRARAVLTHGTVEEIAAVDKGHVAVSAVAKEIRSGKAPASRSVAQPKVLKNARGRAFPVQPLNERMSRCLDQLEAAVDVLGQIMNEPADISSIAEWAARLERARTALTRIINASRQRSAA